MRRVQMDTPEMLPIPKQHPPTLVGNAQSALRKKRYTRKVTREKNNRRTAIWVSGDIKFLKFLTWLESLKFQKVQKFHEIL